MLARIARFEGADAADLEDSVARIREEAASGPPEGVPSTGLMVLHDTENGRALAIALFENEEDYRKGHETLESMSPPGGGMGQRVSVEKYEVAVQVEA